MLAAAAGLMLPLAALAQEAAAPAAPVAPLAPAAAGEAPGAHFVVAPAPDPATAPAAAQMAAPQQPAAEAPAARQMAAQPAPAPVAAAQPEATPAAQPAADAPPVVAPAFASALADAVVRDKPLADYYRDAGYAPLWTAPEDAARRQAFLDALAGAADQGLPAARYGRDALVAKLQGAQTERDRAEAEAAMSRAFLQYARDASTGVLTPSDLDPNSMVRVVKRPDPVEELKAFAAADPAAWLADLLPTAPEYNALLKARLELIAEVRDDAWGPTVPGKGLKPGQTGDAVVALRNRLIAMGYLAPTAEASMTPACRPR